MQKIRKYSIALLLFCSTALSLFWWPEQPILSKNYALDVHFCQLWDNSTTTLGQLWTKFETTLTQLRKNLRQLWDNLIGILSHRALDITDQARKDTVLQTSLQSLDEAKEPTAHLRRVKHSSCLESLYEDFLHISLFSHGSYMTDKHHRRRYVLFYHCCQQYSQIKVSTSSTCNGLG